ncbi:MAG: hypothetical protein CL777_00470 [Chloroflexi bacterium]|nr:hypothetical protein [Chloroflexota bacterium]
MPPALVLSGVTKLFGKIRALDALDLTLEAGSIHGFVGPNGAGKTTMLSVVSGLKRQTSGEIEFGVPARQMMLMPDTPEFFPLLTAREVVDLARHPFRHEIDETDVSSIIREVGLEEAIDRRVGGFSRGMKQRLGLAAALIGRPELVLLDEPCSALDPIGRREVLDMISQLKGRATVLFSTHILSDVEDVCDSVTVVDHGKALYEGTVKGIKKKRGQSFEQAVLELLLPERGGK